MRAGASAARTGGVLIQPIYKAAAEVLVFQGFAGLLESLFQERILSGTDDLRRVDDEPALQANSFPNDD